MPSRRAWAWWIFGTWTLFAFASIAQVGIALNQRGDPVPWGFLIPERLLDWYTCAIFTPACFWLVRRFPLNERPLRLTLPLYAAVTTLCVVLKCFLFVGIARLTGRMGTITLANVFLSSFLFDLIVLWGVTAVIHGLELQDRLRQREQVALQLRAQLSEAELQVLKGQLRPHFLFNTLNGVASLIHTAPATADFVVVQLADLLRSSLDHDAAKTIPLADELALLNKYLNIMEARFDGRLTVHRDIHPDTLAAHVPQFLLQPLVENAFEHGLGRRAGAGQITIRATAANGSLELAVSDDGVGLTSTADLSEGVGLYNTRRQLEHLYGDRQSLTLTSLPNGGATVTVRLPRETA
ncbi:MAG: histidine kinase [Gemmatimonadaceae bacterium]